jgi:hypothetical protein
MSTGSLKYIGCYPRKFMGLCTVSLRNKSLLDILLGTKRLQWAGLAKVQGLRLGAPHDLATVMKYLSNSFPDTSLYVVLMTLYVACMSLYVMFITCSRGTNYKCVTKLVLPFSEITVQYPLYLTGILINLWIPELPKVNPNSETSLKFIF